MDCVAEMARRPVPVGDAGEDGDVAVVVEAVHGQSVVVVVLWRRRRPHERQRPVALDTAHI